MKRIKKFSKIRIKRVSETCDEGPSVYWEVTSLSKNVQCDGVIYFVKDKVAFEIESTDFLHDRDAILTISDVKEKHAYLDEIEKAMRFVVKEKK